MEVGGVVRMGGDEAELSGGSQRLDAPDHQSVAERVAIERGLDSSFSG